MPPRVPPWPVALLTGFLGSGKTTLVRALLAADGMADTMVVVNEFSEVGIDHALIAAVHGDVVLLRGGCLCCGVRQDLARTLRDLHLRWRSGSLPNFARVIIETSGVADPGPVVATLCAHPLVQDAYVLRGITTLVDAEHGLVQLAKHPVGRRQVAAADRVLITKPDRASAGDTAVLAAELGAINTIAALGTCLFGDATVGSLLAPVGYLRPQETEGATEPHARHTGGLSSTTLVCEQPLHWPAVQRWLGLLFAEAETRLLRLKGILDIAGYDAPVVLQAVHHTLYPVELLPAWPGRRTSTLVLISDGELSLHLQSAFGACADA